MELAECNWPWINREGNGSKRKKGPWSWGEELGPAGNADGFLQWCLAANSLLSTDMLQEKSADFFNLFFFPPLIFGLIIQAPKAFICLLSQRVWDEGVLQQ